MNERGVIIVVGWTVRLIAASKHRVEGKATSPDEAPTIRPHPFAAAARRHRPPSSLSPAKIVAAVLYHLALLSSLRERTFFLIPYQSLSFLVQTSTAWPADTATSVAVTGVLAFSLMDRLPLL